MSESRDNDMLLAMKADKKGVNEARAKQKEEEARKKQTRNTILGAIGSVVVLGLVLFNQGVFSKSTPAFTLDGTQYTATEVQMFYTQPMYSALMGQLLPEAGGTAFDFNTPASEQYYSASTTFQTWHEYFVQEAVMTLAKTHVISEDAKTSGFSLPQEALEELEDLKFQLDTTWVGYYPNKESYIRGQFGAEMTSDKYYAIMEREIIANYYQTYLYENLQFSDNELQTHYDENPDSFDIVTTTQFNFSTTPLVLDIDENGVEIPATEEQIEAFDTNKALMGMLADDLMLAIEEGTSWSEIETEFGGLASQYFIEEPLLGYSLQSNSDYGAWLLEEERKEGDATLTGSGVGYNATYTITVFEGRERAEETTSNIHQILWEVVPSAEGTEEEPAEITDDDWAAAKVEAEEWLQAWLDSGADLEEFGAFATENSKASTASYGGFIENATSFDGVTSTYSQDCLDWVTDSNRSAGDSMIIENDNDFYPGWHILYFEDWNRSIWEISAENSLTTEHMTEWLDDLVASLDGRIVYGDGMASIEEVSLF